MVEEFEFRIGDRVRFEPVESFFKAGSDEISASIFQKWAL